MSKDTWLDYKEEFKKIKRELTNHLETPLSKDNLDHHVDQELNIQKGCLIKILELPQNVDKQSIKAAVSHFSTPKYVDFKKSSDQTIIRFENPTITKAFFDKYTTLKEFEINQKKVLNCIVYDR